MAKVKPFFKKGQVVEHKANPGSRIVILRVRRKIFNQRYTVRWHDGKEYCTGGPVEHELVARAD